MTRELKIDPDFKGHIPQLFTEEYELLEKSILADGCRDPLVVWNGILIDGHNRYAICQEHNVPFQVVEKDFPDRESALDWMDENQLGRRNLTPDARRLLIGRRYNRAKKDRTENLHQGSPNGHFDRSGGDVENTASFIGKQHGASEKTVRRAGKFAEEVEAHPEMAEAIAKGEPVAKVKPVKAEPKPEVDANAKERRKMAGLTREAIEDDLIAAREEITRLKGINASQKAEISGLKELIKALENENELGRTVGNLKRKLDAANFTVNENATKARRAQYKQKKAEEERDAALKRVAEVEAMEIRI